VAQDFSPARRRMAPMPTRTAEIPTRPFGNTGVRVSILGMGGWHMIVPKTDADTVRLVHEAIDSGITFFDNAWDYNDGVSEERMGKALAGRREQAFLMTKVCTHGRDGKVAMRQLEDSLRRLRTDYLDLWQIHEVAFDDEPRRHFAKGGVVEALDRARKQGKVRFVGFTGHKDPALHLEMLSYDYAWDAVQMPLNCFDGSFRSFEQRVLPELTRRGIASIGMKSLCGDRTWRSRAASNRCRPRPWPPCASAWRRPPPMDAGSCSRSPSRSKVPNRAGSTVFRRRTNYRASPHRCLGSFGGLGPWRGGSDVTAT
jgi:aryl-alcohol dehydrogenase-like predicted oxidoreductase